MGIHSLSEVSSTMIRSAVLLALVSVAIVAAVNVNTDELAQKAIDEALKLGMGVLDSVMFDNFHEDAAKVCYWNDWAARDGRCPHRENLQPWPYEQAEEDSGNPQRSLVLLLQTAGPCHPWTQAGLGDQSDLM